MTVQEREALDAIKDLLAIAFHEIEVVENGIRIGAPDHPDTADTYAEAVERVLSSVMLAGAKLKALPRGHEIRERYFEKLNAEKQKRIAAGTWKSGPEVAEQIIATLLPGKGEHG